MKPFNYEEAKKDLSKIVTRDQRHFEVLDIHLLRADIPYPLIVAYRDEEERVGTHVFTKDGKFTAGAEEESELDLFLKEDKGLIDWTKLPEDTLVETTEGLRYFQSSMENHQARVFVYDYGASSQTAGDMICGTSKAKLVEQPEFTVWRGGYCPVPEGVLVEAILRDGTVITQEGATLRWRHKGYGGNYEEDYKEYDIIAYRIIGVADGYSPYFQGREF